MYTSHKATLNKMLIPIYVLLLVSCSSAESRNPKTDTVSVFPDTSMVVKNQYQDSSANEPVYDSTKKYIYLTFDDGPQAGTLESGQICRNLDVKASFFMVGAHTNDKWEKGVVKVIKEDFPKFVVVNHSFSHANNRYVYFYKHPEFALQDFLRAQDTLKPHFKIIRLPGNSAWVTEKGIRSSNLTKPVSQLLDSAGYNVLGWDVEWNFNHKSARPVQSAETMIKYVENAFSRSYNKNHVVILTHDRMFRKKEDADSLIKFITVLKSHPDYIFETVDRYPHLKK